MLKKYIKKIKKLSMYDFFFMNYITSATYNDSSYCLKKLV